MKILGIDPGKTTGIVECTLSDDQSLWVDRSYEVSGFINQCSTLADWIAEEGIPGVDLVICERFVSRPNTFVADAESALKPIGVVEWYTQLYGIECHFPLPQERNSVSDKALKESDYWLTGQEHARQALRHVLAYCVNTLRHKPTMLKLHPRR